MCGIAGLVCFKETCSEEEHISMIKLINETQSHRGPDDSGVVSLGKVCLGSTRLNIIDLTKAGHMPMLNSKKDKWITYNGEVYNYKNIRRELERHGYVFKSQTDTEVVLNAFEEWGEDCLERFNGMFAFAIYDINTELVTLVRDRFGIKPLYYMNNNNHLFFASEIKALIKLGSNHQINKQRLIEWNLYRNIDILSSQTMIENICSVLPGQKVKIKRQKAESFFYYKTTSAVKSEIYKKYNTISTKKVVSEIEDTLHHAIKDRLVSDVPVGTLCSGGLDSSLITAIASKHMKDISAFHVSITDYPELDEKQYAEKVSTHLGIELICLSMDAKKFREGLTEAIYLSDLPLTYPNSIAFHLICKVAKKHGVKVLLSGEGADELFGGYAWRYRRQRQILRLKSILKKLPQRLCKGIELIGFVSNGLPATSHRFHELLPHSTAFVDRYDRLELRKECESSYHFEIDPVKRVLLGEMLADLTDYLLPLLRRLDRMSMGTSVESRVPFLDHRLVHNCINLPLTYRLKGKRDKWLLKKIAEKYLPKDIVYRRKSGFPFPLIDYLKPLVRKDIFNNGFCLNVLELKKAGIGAVLASWQNNVHAFFSLLSLEIWGRLFIMGESVEHVSALVNNVNGDKKITEKTIFPHSDQQNLL